ncbi:MAG: F0F1 ATP synthase subunit A [Clostridia bacterium]|nr:F0F1 ATP synthase subunit A [Clostridia bacterium]
MLEVKIIPESFYIGPINVGHSVIMAWMTIGVLIVLLVIGRLFLRKMKDVPTGFQNFAELLVESMYNFAHSKIGEAADLAAPLVMTFMAYVFCCTFIEITGVAPATEDINCTLALGICSFLTVNIVAIRYKGLKGRFKLLTEPSPVVFPIKILTDLIAPCSMAIRLFANVLVGGVIMQLVYMAIPYVVPAAISAYFNVIHVMIQTFVFGLLSLTYIGEALGEED